MKINCVYDNWLIKVEKQFEDEAAFGGHTMRVDTSFRPYWLVRRYGTVVAAPTRAGNPYGSYLPKVGDKVYFHHFVAQDDNFIKIEGEKYFIAEHHQLYFALINGEIEPLRNQVIVLPVPDDQASRLGLVSPLVGARVHSFGVIASLNDYGRSYGLKIGQIISFLRSRDYDMDFMGARVYCVPVESILFEADKDLIDSADSVKIATK